MDRRRVVVAVAGVMLLAACSGSGGSARPSTTTTRASAVKATLEIRPILGIVLPAQVGGFFPAGSEILPRAGHSGQQYIVGPAEVTGKSLRSAKAVFLRADPGWVIDLTFDQRGSERFNALAARLFPKQPPMNSIAVVVDGVVRAAPQVMTSTFEGGSIQISGDFTGREAKALAASLAP